MRMLKISMELRMLPPGPVDRLAWSVEWHKHSVCIRHRRDYDPIAAGTALQIQIGKNSSVPAPPAPLPVSPRSEVPR
ncbi:hypothetical protein AGR1B_Cc40205 [Agrobacterium fabacearum S56]|nr:hypothetical protein AGR1B_Cc40205 [Agrobacterium fabacearum S56]